MSHFTVAVLSYSPEDEAIAELLAPFDENSEEYFELEMAAEDPAELSEEYERCKDEYTDFAEFLSRQYGYVLHKGSIGYRCNPNAKWDWYQIGGRWMNFLRLKDGREGFHGSPSWATDPDQVEKPDHCDQALLMDIDLSPDPEMYAKAIRFWEINVDGDSIRDDENKDEFWNLYKPEYYIQNFGTKENYATDAASFRTWAIVTPDGEWHEKGSMGWFGTSDANMSSREAYRNAFNKILGKYSNDPDIWITIVDCHI